jgi:hypothetical protein
LKQKTPKSISPKFYGRRRSNIYQKYLPFELPSFMLDEDVFEENERPLSSTIRGDEDEPTLEPSIQEIREDIHNLTQAPGYKIYLESFHPLVRSFVDSSITGTRDTDHKYGLYHDINSEKWKIGDTEADFQGQDFKIKDLTYKGTVGLYELLFFKDPQGYTVEDLNNYMDILKRTNAYRRNNDPNDQVQGTTDVKYLTIIKPYLVEKNIIKPQIRSSKSSSVSSTSSLKNIKPPQRPRTQSKKGAGIMMNLSNKKIDYVYYDDPNELVQRLKLLMSSQMAGHTGHQNEIISILEELREAKIIQ